MDVDVEISAFSGIEFRALEIASELGHGAAYDAHYLALAEAIGAECWTADGRLHRSAVSAYPFVRLLGEDAG